VVGGEDLPAIVLDEQCLRELLLLPAEAEVLGKESRIRKRPSWT
jgi:hypothetical protein